MNISKIEGGLETTPLINTNESRSCLGRLWQWLEPKKSLLTRGVLATAGLVSCATITYFTATHFQENLVNFTHAVFEGSGLGISATLLFGSILPQSIGTALADWVARWSYEGLELVSQFYLTAGSPIDGYGLWNTTAPPQAIQELASLGNSAIAATIAFLSLRILMREEQPEHAAVEREPIRMLESPSSSRLLFSGEQMAKGILGATLLALQKNNVLTAPEWTYLGYFLLGNIAGASLGKISLLAKEKWLPQKHSQNQAMKTLQKVARLVEITSFGALFVLDDMPSFLLSGFISGGAKMIHLYNFEKQTRNTETVAPFIIKQTDNIAKGVLIGLATVWYTLKLANNSTTSATYFNTASYLALTTFSYFTTRHLGKNFEPGENNRLFNTLRFYFIHFDEALVLPYMLIRSAESIRDALPNESFFANTRNWIALSSLALATGNNRALQGMRSERSPSEISELALLISWFILASRGQLT